ncbi:hypothetical protein VP01_1300g2 [Puccinia sorghi]|uniref:Uncharacterized protein n=1 Tax=Puccinia sorghi TaxID=27349 RepID=A0A0L6VNL6_9BASI|nr:hypothetical protein VP01_1300g2 [Puccinia sorghi]
MSHQSSQSPVTSPFFHLAYQFLNCFLKISTVCFLHKEVYAIKQQNMESGFCYIMFRFHQYIPPQGLWYIIHCPKAPSEPLLIWRAWYSLGGASAACKASLCQRRGLQQGLSGNDSWGGMTPMDRPESCLATAQPYILPRWSSKLHEFGRVWSALPRVYFTHIKGGSDGCIQCSYKTNVPIGVTNCPHSSPYLLHETNSWTIALMSEGKKEINKNIRKRKDEEMTIQERQRKMKKERKGIKTDSVKQQIISNLENVEDLDKVEDCKQRTILMWLGLRRRARCEFFRNRFLTYLTWSAHYRQKLDTYKAKKKRPHYTVLQPCSAADAKALVKRKLATKIHYFGHVAYSCILVDFVNKICCFGKTLLVFRPKCQMRKQSRKAKILSKQALGPFFFKFLARNQTQKSRLADELNIPMQYQVSSSGCTYPLRAVTELWRMTIPNDKMGESSLTLDNFFPPLAKLATRLSYQPCSMCSSLRLTEIRTLPDARKICLPNLATCLLIYPITFPRSEHENQTSSLLLDKSKFIRLIDFFLLCEEACMKIFLSKKCFGNQGHKFLFQRCKIQIISFFSNINAARWHIPSSWISIITWISKPLGCPHNILIYTWGPLPSKIVSFFLLCFQHYLFYNFTSYKKRDQNQNRYNNVVIPSFECLLYEWHTSKENLLNCLQLTCSMLQPSYHPNSTSRLHQSWRKSGVTTEASQDFLHVNCKQLKKFFFEVTLAPGHTRTIELGGAWFKLGLTTSGQERVHIFSLQKPQTKTKQKNKITFCDHRPPWLTFLVQLNKHLMLSVPISATYGEGISCIIWNVNPCCLSSFECVAEWLEILFFFFLKKKKNEIEKDKEVRGFETPRDALKYTRTRDEDGRMRRNEGSEHHEQQFSLAVMMRGGGGGVRGPRNRRAAGRPSLLAHLPPPPPPSSSALLVGAPHRASSSSSVATSAPESASAQPVVSEQSIAQKLARRFPNAARIYVHDVSGIFRSPGLPFFFWSRLGLDPRPALPDSLKKVVDIAFAGLNQIKQHQMIHATLALEIPRIHGLQVRPYFHPSILCLLSKLDTSSCIFAPRPRIITPIRLLDYPSSLLGSPFHPQQKHSLACCLFFVSSQPSFSSSHPHQEQKKNKDNILLLAITNNLKTKQEGHSCRTLFLFFFGLGGRITTKAHDGKLTTNYHSSVSIATTAISRRRHPHCLCGHPYCPVKWQKQGQLSTKVLPQQHVSDRDKDLFMGLLKEMNQKNCVIDKTVPPRPPCYPHSIDSRTLAAIDSHSLPHQPDSSGLYFPTENLFYPTLLQHPLKPLESPNNCFRLSTHLISAVSLCHHPSAFHQNFRAAPQKLSFETASTPANTPQCLYKGDQGGFRCTSGKAAQKHSMRWGFSYLQKRRKNVIICNKGLFMALPHNSIIHVYLNHCWIHVPKLIEEKWENFNHKIQQKNLVMHIFYINGKVFACVQ